MKEFDLLPLLDYIDPATLLNMKDMMKPTGTHGRKETEPGIMMANVKRSGRHLTMKARL